MEKQKRRVLMLVWPKRTEENDAKSSSYKNWSGYIAGGMQFQATFPSSLKGTSEQFICHVGLWHC